MRSNPPELRPPITSLIYLSHTKPRVPLPQITPGPGYQTTKTTPI